MPILSVCTNTVHTSDAVGLCSIGNRHISLKYEQPGPDRFQIRCTVHRPHSGNNPEKSRTNFLAIWKNNLCAGYLYVKRTAERISLRGMKISLRGGLCRPDKFPAVRHCTSQVILSKKPDCCKWHASVQSTIGAQTAFFLDQFICKHVVQVCFLSRFMLEDNLQSDGMVSSKLQKTL